MSTQPAYDTNFSLFLDTTIPNSTRIFDYLLGGSTNFEADRQAAENMLKIFPALRKWVRLRHAFVQEAAQQLAQEGFVQFLDLGSGIPSGDQIHMNTPGVRVVYSDINPVAVSYGSSLYNDLTNVAYVLADARNVQALLMDRAVSRLVDLHHPVAIGLNALLLFLSETDAKLLVQQLYEWAAVGSKLFIVFQTRQSGSDTEEYQRFLLLSRQVGFPIQLYTLEQSIELLKPWHLCHLESIADFLGLPPQFITITDQADIGILLYAAILSKEV